jgi:pyruvate dehydrogenase E1 component beta subunit
MAVMNLVQAVNDGLRQELARDDSVMVLGEDVGRLGGVFRATEGLLEEFGQDRCVDTPLAETGIVGAAIGLALAGWRPICEMQYEAFSYPALDQVLSHVSRYRWRSGGALEMPVVIRMPYGGGVRAPELHEDSPEAYYAHAPGIKLAMPSTPADAKGLITAAVRDPDPVVVLEPKALYRSSVGPVPDGEHFVELGRAAVRRHGTDATLIAYGAMVPVALASADELSERGAAEVEVLDLRTLTPLDEESILDSVAKTGRAVIVHEAPRTAGFGAEVAALLAERGILDLRAPVRRVAGYDVPYPYWSLEDRYIPSVDRIVAALEEVLRF